MKLKISKNISTKLRKNGTVLDELGILVDDATENLQIDEETGEIANEELGKVL